MQKKKITFSQVNNYLLKRGLIVKKKNFTFNKDFRIIFFSFLTCLVLILTFSIAPIIINFKNTGFFASTEINNNSSNNFKKILKEKTSDENVQAKEKLNIRELFEDIFKFDDSPTDTIRLSILDIEQLFGQTNYNLKNVRATKLVKPIPLDLLPQKMKKIENTKRRKNLFIKIILPLILEENNRIKFDRIKLFNILNKNNNSEIEKNWLKAKFKQYGIANRDLSALKVRMDIIPVSLAIAQAAKETGWGTSRFAIEGNALFGQWTWSGDGIKPAGADNDSTHKVMKFKVLKASVRAYARNLNTHSSYKEFRMNRAISRDNKQNLNSLTLVRFLDKYAETGVEYTNVLRKIIEQNNLQDFDDARLLPSSIELKSLI